MSVVDVEAEPNIFFRFADLTVLPPFLSCIHTWFRHLI
jgi:hypothetical protein